MAALDLASQAGLAALVVARAGLGTLNHVVLTVDALRHRDVPVLGVVLNLASQPPTLAEATNPAALARLLPGLASVVLPRVEGHDALGIARLLAPLLSGLLPPGALEPEVL